MCGGKGWLKNTRANLKLLLAKGYPIKYTEMEDKDSPFISRVIVCPCPSENPGVEIKPSYADDALDTKQGVRKCSRCGAVHGRYESIEQLVNIMMNERNDEGCRVEAANYMIAYGRLMLKG